LAKVSILIFSFFTKCSQKLIHSFALMKKVNSKITHGFLLLVMAAYFAVQGLHSWHHLEDFFSTEKCHHSFETSKQQITHQHEKTEKCIVCHFSLDSFVSQNTLNTFNSIQETHFKKTTFFVREIVSVFHLGKKSLRAPPFFN